MQKREIRKGGGESIESKNGKPAQIDNISTYIYIYIMYMYTIIDIYIYIYLFRSLYTHTFYTCFPHKLSHFKAQVCEYDPKKNFGGPWSGVFSEK